MIDKILFWVGIFLLFGLFGLILGVSFIGIFLNGIGGSSGMHTVYITAVEKNDNLIWDSTLVYVKSSTESTQEDIYCVNDFSLKRVLEHHSKQGDKVTISYSNPFWFWLSLCNGGQSVIVEVKKEGD